MARFAALVLAFATGWLAGLFVEPQPAITAFADSLTALTALLVETLGVLVP